VSWSKDQAAQMTRKARDRGESALIGDGCVTGKRLWRAGGVRATRLWRSKAAAKRALKRVQAERQTAGHDRFECAIYECPLCGGWHMTSQAQRSRAR
jgi:hypothetical protein